MASSHLEVPAYEQPPPWIAPENRSEHPDYCNNPEPFLPRTVQLARTTATDALGFNIRGGKEHHCGIFLSKVMPNTEVHRLGLKEGDQLLWVNGINFEDIDHASAVKILKANTEVTMQVRYFPYGYRKTYERVGAVVSCPLYALYGSNNSPKDDRSTVAN
uniref:PDZ domain-containing protein 11-like n=1 Tax=Hirondellea gigas TaxID=1518452 RepID=A0A2P2I2S6_9CRUS